ncbi:MAG TPA: hypothetical protein IAA26_11255 [Candidatus Blautia faecipullorum]|nr:hypothetical protein [Candidatus Blautia faecipullorum]
MHSITIIPLPDSYDVIIDNIKFEDGSAAIMHYRYGSFLVALHNFDINYVAAKVTSTFKSFRGDNLDELIEMCFENMGESHNDIVIVMALLNEIHSELNNYINSDGKMGASQILEDIFKAYIAFKTLIENQIKNNFSNVDMSTMLKFQDGAIFAKFFLDKNKTMRVAYSMCDIYSLFSIDTLNVQEKKICIKRCENCGRLFLPQTRSDEIYCDNICENGKTCKQIGYANKLKADPFKAEYRKAYKTQHAKMKRNQENIPNYKEKFFEPWVKAAKDALGKYQLEDNIDAFIQWLHENK